LGLDLLLAPLIPTAETLVTPVGATHVNVPTVVKACDPAATDVVIELLDPL
jgi:hypothetical protein